MKGEPWEDAPFPGVDQPALAGADWVEALTWFEREILLDFLSRGYTRGEALNAWQQQRIIVALDHVLTAIEGNDDVTG